jgi:hypothetical protein
MRAVVDFVDQDAIDRNSDWLLTRRKADGSGQFDLNPRALDTFGRSSQDITDAYIVWTLSSLSTYNATFLANEFKNIQRIVDATNDPYLLSLIAGAYFNIGQLEKATAIAQRLIPFQNTETGAIAEAATTITSSMNTNLVIETTSLAMVAWMNINTTQFSP